MERLRVLTLNLWNRMGPWPERLRLIRDELARLDPDLLGLQEVLEADDGASQAEEIARGLPLSHHAFAVAHEVGGGVRFGNAALSRWPIARRAAFPLPAHGTDESRVLLLAEIDAPFGRLPFFVTHLNWKFDHGHAREAQVRAIAETLEQEGATGTFPPVLVGDFNAEPEATEIRFLRGLHALEGRSVYLADAFAFAGVGAGATFDARTNAYAQRTREPPRRIDYIFTRPDERHRGLPLAARVVMDQPQGGVFASDHYGVLAELSVAPLR